MLIKKTAVVNGVQEETWYAIGVARTVYSKHGHKLVCTSLNDSHEDRPGSLHNKGLAVDMRTRDIPVSTLAFIVSDLKELLEPEGYDVVEEKNHIHVEYDPKNGECWQERVD